MKMKSKRFAIALSSILLVLLCLGVSSALADGESSEGTSVTPFAGQVRAGVTPDSIIDVSQTLSSVSGEYTMNGNIIELDVANRVYEIKGATTTYGIKATADCTILLNGATIQPNTVICPMDLNGKVVTIILQNGTTNYLNPKNDPNGTPGLRTANSSLTLEGSGKLGVTGEGSSSAIGGNPYEAGGIVIISDHVELTATSGVNRYLWLWRSWNRRGQSRSRGNSNHFR